MVHTACLHLQKTLCPAMSIAPTSAFGKKSKMWACMQGGGLPSPWQLCRAILAVVPVHVASQNDISACVFIQHLKRLQAIGSPSGLPALLTEEVMQVKSAYEWADEMMCW